MKTDLKPENAEALTSLLTDAREEADSLPFTLNLENGGRVRRVFCNPIDQPGLK